MPTPIVTGPIAASPFLGTMPTIHQFITDHVSHAVTETVSRFGYHPDALMEAGAAAGGFLAARTLGEILTGMALCTREASIVALPLMPFLVTRAQAADDVTLLPEVTQLLQQAEAIPYGTYSDAIFPIGTQLFGPGLPKEDQLIADYYTHHAATLSPQEELALVAHMSNSVAQSALSSDYATNWVWRAHTQDSAEEGSQGISADVLQAIAIIQKIPQGKVHITDHGYGSVRMILDSRDHAVFTFFQTNYQHMTSMDLLALEIEVNSPELKSNMTLHFTEYNNSHDKPVAAEETQPLQAPSVEGHNDILVGTGAVVASLCLFLLYRKHRAGVNQIAEGLYAFTALPFVTIRKSYRGQRDRHQAAVLKQKALLTLHKQLGELCHGYSVPADDELRDNLCTLIPQIMALENSDQRNKALSDFAEFALPRLKDAHYLNPVLDQVATLACHARKDVRDQAYAVFKNYFSSPTNDPRLRRECFEKIIQRILTNENEDVRHDGTGFAAATREKLNRLQVAYEKHSPPEEANLSSTERGGKLLREHA